MGVWDLCAPLITEKRKKAFNVLYLRRDFERLALKSWLYQYHLGYKVPITILNENSGLTKILPDKDGVDIVCDRMKKLERKSEKKTKKDLRQILS